MFECTFRFTDVYHCMTFYVYITHAKDKHTDKLAKIGITIGFIRYTSFAFAFIFIQG